MDEGSVRGVEDDGAGRRGGIDDRQRVVADLEADPGSDKGHGDQDDPSSGEGMCLTKLARLPDGSLLNNAALAACLNVSTRTLQRMIKRGQLPNGVRLGGRRMWMARKILEFITAQSDRLAAEARKLHMRFGAEGV